MQAAGAATLVNLASQEYYKAVSGSLKAEIITPVFKDWKNDGYKTISFYAKRARGLMVRYAAERQIQNVEDLKTSIWKAMPTTKRPAAPANGYSCAKRQPENGKTPCNWSNTCRRSATAAANNAAIWCRMSGWQSTAKS